MKPEKEREKEERGQRGTDNEREIQHGANNENAKKGVYWM